ncbi:hypothetical protein F5050DRAFT_1798464 [Lentinula boryana]|uniref:C2H2-type domain-containing protein n=1 Tax=Lentinula boryana TaxID=40481 RepID=A0ABQ8QIX7_9AGAR|nr:hypothetical protein F5050DRAFT_1798464 [Lentinula boryana]
MFTHCHGCQKPFEGGQFLQHIRKTHNPACRAFSESIQTDATASLSHHSTTNLLNSLLNRYCGPISTEEHNKMGPPPTMDPAGDFFGAYADLDEQDDLDMQDASRPPIEVSVNNSSLSDLDSEDEDQGEDILGLNDEHGWEAEPDHDSRALSPELIFPEDHFNEPLHLPHSRPPPPTAPNCIREPYVVHFPDPCAGAPIPTETLGAPEHNKYCQMLKGQSLNPWAPFISKIDWKVAHWAKLRGPSSTSFSELLAIDGVSEKLGLSFRNANELNAIIDTKLPTLRPPFQRQEVIVQGEAFEVYFRDILECTKALFGEAEFAEYLKFAPERHFENNECKEQLYHDMHTGSWWWSTQEKLDKYAGPGQTIVPIILSSDKTQVTVFHNKSAYPVYMSIGNIPKEIRRKPSRHAYILLGYLPTTNLAHIKNAASRRRSIANLFHTCMRHIVKPLEEAGATGVIMTSGNGVRRHSHPIFAVHIGDYPEQILVMCGITGYCPCCTVPRQRIGENIEPHPLRHLRSILEALQMADQSPGAFIKACREVGIKPIFEPYWAKLPYSNVYHAITPDILHQLYQGVFKHMKNWVIEAYGAHEIDAQCRRLPPNHNIRVFMKGISTLQRISGAEHAQISHFFLGLIAEAPLPNCMSSVRLVCCLRGLLDFLFLSQYPVQSTTSLGLLSDSLEHFHGNKQIFIDLGIRSDFHIPKIHFMNHYVEAIERMGSLDNYNTEYTERLHIDLAKDAYQATNRKDELAQMTNWLERKEKVMKHASYISWRQSGEHPPLRSHWIPPGLNTTRILKMTKNPSVYRVSVDDIAKHYGATFFRAALARYVVQLIEPGISGLRLDDKASAMLLGVSHVSAYHCVKYMHYDFFTQVSSTADSIHVQPAHIGKYGKVIPGRFDTALVRISDSDSSSGTLCISNIRVARVRLVFTLPDKVANSLFAVILPNQNRPCHLAYVEWFTPFSASPDANHHLYQVSHSGVEGGHLASVIDVCQLIRSVHLFPKFGRVADRTWTSSTVLDKCKTFLVNSDSDRHIYQLFSG